MEQQKQKCVATGVESRSTEKRKVTVGSIWKSKRCGEFEVVKITNSKSAEVRFLSTGSEVKTSIKCIEIGVVRDKYFPVVCGVGFVGIGKFKPTKNRSKTKAYVKWLNMINRCYSINYLERFPTYKDCLVCKEWHNFQNFANWFYSNYSRNTGDSDLDKDLKIIGNKVYSPEACMLVSGVVNSFTLDASAARGVFLIGVRNQDRYGKFVSCCGNPFTGKQDYLGVYTSEIEAHLAWRKRKSELAYELAMIQDRDEVKQALLNWKEALDNNLIHPY